MKISEIITDKYKLRMPPTVYYELLADVVEAEEEQEPKTGHWIKIFLTDTNDINGQCSECGFIYKFIDGYTEKSLECPNCGARMVEPQESEG